MNIYVLMPALSEYIYIADKGIKHNNKKNLPLYYAYHTTEREYQQNKKVLKLFRA